MLSSAVEVVGARNQDINQFSTAFYTINHTTWSWGCITAYCILIFEQTAFSLPRVVLKQPATITNLLRLTETFPEAFYHAASKDTAGITAPIFHMGSSPLLPWIQGSTAQLSTPGVSQTPDVTGCLVLLSFSLLVRKKLPSCTSIRDLDPEASNWSDVPPPYLESYWTVLGLDSSW